MSVSAFDDEWKELEKDYAELEENNEKYLRKLKEITNLQQTCSKHIAHQRYRMKAMKKSLKISAKNLNKEFLDKMEENFLKREAELQYVEQTLPKKSGKYLRLALGNLDVSILNIEEKFKYKDEYEKFKLVNHVIAVVVAIIILNFPFRTLQLAYLGFLVWYYCTISVRESILKVNGSRIKGWWRIHHIISAAEASILLVWPESETWSLFRSQFFYYTIYSGFIQYLQFKYQRGVLYRLKALGHRDNMDITIEGFHSWMWRGLTFLLPFLFAGYIFQLANVIVLYNLSYHPQATWHVPASGLMFLVLFLGNTTTTIMVIPNKIRHKMMFQYRVMTQRLYNAVSKNHKENNNSLGKTK